MVAKDGKIHRYSIIVHDDLPPQHRTFEMARATEELYRATGLSPKEHRVMWETIESPFPHVSMMSATLVANEYWEKVERFQRRRRKELSST